MTPCLTIGDLDLIAAGDRPAAGGEEHLGSCGDCRKRLEEIRVNNIFLAEFRSIAPPPGAGDAAPPVDADSIAGYTLRRVLGRGGQGLVYEAIETATGRRVAVKVLLFGSLASHGRRARFDREISIASEMRHPHVVSIYEHGVTSGGRPYFAMEYVEGEPIDRHAATGGRPSVEETLRLFGKVCDAVRHAHQRGIIHRDLKPGNILVDASGEPHVLDFGLAKRIDGPLGTDLTRTGDWHGTIAYAAPEQLAGDERAEDTRTDVHALGVVLYEILTGRHPFSDAGTVSEIVRDIASRVPDPPSAHRAGIGDEIDTIVLKALAKEPERRYESAAGLLDDLRRVEEGLPIAAKRDSTLYVLRKIAGQHRRVVAASLLVLAFAVASVAWIVSAEHRAREGFHRARESAAELAVRLAESEIERGRTTAQPQAESLVWRHHLLRSTLDRPGEAHELTDPPGPLLSYWALWDLYRRHPCLATQSVKGPAEFDVRFVGDSTDVRAVRVDGTVFGFGPRGEAVPLLEAGAGRVFRFSGDGRRIAAAAGAAIRVLDIATGETVASFDAGERVEQLTLDLAGTRLAAATADHRIRGFDLASGRALFERPGQGSTVIGLELSPDGEWLATRLANGTFEITGTAAGSRLEPLAPRERGGARGRPAFDRGARTLVAALNAGDPASPTWESFGVWRRGASDAPGFSLVSVLPGLLPYFGNIAVNSDVACAAHWDRVVVWNLSSSSPAETRRAYGGHEREVRAVAVSSDGDRIASVDREGVMRVWESAADGCVETWPGSVGRSYHSAVHGPAGRFLAASGYEPGSGRGFVDVFDPDGNRVSGGSTTQESIVASVAWSRSGDELATASHDGTLRAFKVGENGSLSAAAELRHAVPLNSVAFSPDGRDLAVATGDGAFIRSPWDGSGPVRTLEGHSGRVPSVAYGPAGDVVATGCMDRAVRLFRLDRGLEGRTIGEHGSGVRVVRFSPDGRRLASGGDDAIVRIFDVPSGRSAAVLEGHEAQVFSLAWSPDGTILASGDSVGAIRLWDAADWRPLATLRRGRAMIASLDFSPQDGRHLVAASLTGAVARWNLRYYERHMAGNLAYRLDRLAAGESLDPAGVERWRRWAEAVLGGPESATARR